MARLSVTARACSTVVVGLAWALSVTPLRAEPIVEDIFVYPPSDMSENELNELEEEVELKVGDPLTESAVRATIQRFYERSRFRGVRILTTDLGKDRVRVSIILEPRLRLRAVRVEGAGPVGQTWVKQVLGLAQGGVLDRASLEQIPARLLARLHRRGFRQARVSAPVVGEPGPSGQTDLLLRMQLGSQTLVGETIVQGRLPFSPRLLDLGVSKGEPIDFAKIEPAVVKLSERLRKQGFFDVKVLSVDVLNDRLESGRQIADVALEIDLGLQTRVEIQGNVRLRKATLMEDIEIVRREGSSRVNLAEARDRIVARYERLGYAKAQVKIVVARKNPKQKILFKIEEGISTKVVDVQFKGAISIAQDDLLKEVQESVSSYLSAELSKVGYDPEVVDASVRGGARALTRRRASTRPPKPTEVFVRPAYLSATEAIANAYRLRGFQQVRVSIPEVEIDKSGLTRVSYEIQEGPKWVVEAVSFRGHKNIPGSELIDALGFRFDERPPVEFGLIEKARRGIAQRYRNEGYVFVEVQDSLRAPGGLLGRRAPDFVPCRADRSGPCELELVFAIQEGPQVQLGGLTVKGFRRTLRSVIKGEVILREGELLRQDLIDGTRDNLGRLGIFRSVEVGIVDPLEIEEEKDVAVVVAEADPYSLELGAGVSTEEGFRVFSSFRDRNVFGTALRFRANAKVNLWVEPLLSLYEEDLRREIRGFYSPFGVVGEEPLLLLEYELGAGISYPYIVWLPRGLSLSVDVGAVRDYDPAFAEDNQRLTFTTTYDRLSPKVFGQARPMRLQFRTDVDVAQLNCNDNVESRVDLCSSGSNIRVPGGRTEGTTFYFTLGPRLRWDVRDNPIDPTSGFYLSLEADYAVGLDTNSPDFFQLGGRVSGLTSLNERVSFQASLRAARIFPVTQGLEIPLNRRLYSGGRSTIRGFQEKTLLPRDTTLGEDGQPESDISSGGLLSLSLQSELSVRVVGPFSVASFIDVGDLWRLDEAGVCGSLPFDLFQNDCTLSSGRRIVRRVALAVGGGIRLATPIGPLAVDIAFPLAHRDEAVDAWTLHFSVGSY